MRLGVLQSHFRQCVCVCVQLFRQTKLYQVDGTVVLRDQHCVWLQFGGIQYGFILARCTAQGWMKSQRFGQQSLKEPNLRQAEALMRLAGDNAKEIQLPGLQMPELLLQYNMSRDV